jgi:protein tyrosine phosphatase
MLDYVHFKLNESLNGENQHLVVHCSAGCGRTGTIIALDYCWNLISTGQLPKDFSPFKIGKMLREQRTAMIQTFVCIVSVRIYLFLSKIF